MYTTRWRAPNRIRSLLIGLLASGGAVAAMASPASALTLGTTAYANDPHSSTCDAGELSIPLKGVGYTAAMPSTAAGLLTSWSYDAKAAPANKKVSLAVLKPTGTGYTVTGVDNQTIPNQTTPGLATFVLGTPLSIAPGGLIGLYSPEAGGNCGSTDFSRSGDTLTGLSDAVLPSVGTLYTPSYPAGPGEVNVSAQVTPLTDVAAGTALATPSSISVGDVSTLVYPVAERYGAEGSTTFTTVVPAGVRAVAAVVSGDACQLVGPVVTCGVTWQPGATPPSVVVVVVADAPGTFAISGTLAGGPWEQTPRDNSATAGLNVAALPVQAAPTAAVLPGPVLAAVPVCTTVPVSGMTLSLARRVLTALHCQPTTSKAKSSKTVKKGLVVTTNPGPGKTLASGANVSLIPSSGPAKKKTSKKKKS